MVAIRDPKKERGYTITVPNDVYTQAQRIARAEGRSFNKQVTQALREMIEDRKAAAAERNGAR